MKVALLTSARRGTAAHHLPALIGSDRFQVVQVVLVEGGPAVSGQWRRKLKKILRIGPLGAWMGLRMRRWYDADVRAILPVEDLETLCRQYGIAFAITPAIGHARTVELLRASGADIAISLGNGYIPPRVFTAPRLGMLNVHHELLPERQNAQAVVWSIHDGSPNTGYTIHRIDRGIDTGAIVLRGEVAIRFMPTLRATVSHTMAALLEASAAGLRRVLDDLPKHLADAKPQGAGHKRTTPTFGQYLRIVRQHKRLAARG